jgi:TolB-like protein/tetratricopeptide (TPR) repeat protein
VRPELPTNLERILLKALEKDRRSRFQSAAELRSDLEKVQVGGHSRARWQPAAAALFLLSVILLLPGPRSWLLRLFAGNHAAESGQSEIRPVQRLAVLPFTSAGSEGDQRLMVDGIGDAVATDLAQLPGLRIFSRSTTERYRDTVKAPSAIAGELRADAVLAGTARIEGSQLEVRPRLMRSGSDEPFWTQPFVGDLRDIRTIRSEIARAVAGAMLVRVTPETDSRLASGGTASREAFENHLRGRYFWSKRTDQDIQRAVSFFKAAIDSDPAYSAAYAGLADCYNQFATVAVGRDPRENRSLAIAAARRAIEIDDRNAEAHAALGFSLLYNWDWAGAERELLRALDLNPSYASARVWHAASLVIRRRFDDAVAEVDLARELDPLSPITQTQAGWIRALSGRTGEAIEVFRRVLSAEPDYPWAVMQLASCLTDTGKHQEAIALFQKGATQSGGNPVFLGQLGRAYAEAGRRQDALHVLEKLKRLSRERYVTPHAPAHVCLGLRDLDCYFEALEEGYRQRINYMAFLSVIPLPRDFLPVRQDPRFQDLLRRMGHEPDPIPAQKR